MRIIHRYSACRPGQIRPVSSSQTGACTHSLGVTNTNTSDSRARPFRLVTSGIAVDSFVCFYKSIWWPKTQGVAILTFQYFSCNFTSSKKNAASPGQSGQWCSSAVVSLPESYPKKNLHCLHLMAVLFPVPFLQVSATLRPGAGSYAHAVQFLIFWVFLSNNLRFNYLQAYLLRHHIWSAVKWLRSQMLQSLDMLFQIISDSVR